MTAPSVGETKEGGEGGAGGRGKGRHNKYLTAMSALRVQDALAYPMVKNMFGMPVIMVPKKK